jgi:hypothetical protein
VCDPIADFVACMHHTVLEGVRIRIRRESGGQCLCVCSHLLQGIPKMEPVNRLRSAYWRGVRFFHKVVRAVGARGGTFAPMQRLLLRLDFGGRL